MTTALIEMVDWYDQGKQTATGGYAPPGYSYGTSGRLGPGSGAGQYGSFEDEPPLLEGAADPLASH